MSCPVVKERGLSNPAELSQVLRRGDELRDEWEVQTAGLTDSLGHPSMQVEIMNFSDAMTTDTLRDVEKKMCELLSRAKEDLGSTGKVLMNSL